MFTPTGALVAALVTAGVVMLRLGTNQPLEATGSLVRHMLLGDANEEAQAKQNVRDRIGGDSDLARIMGQEHGINSQIRKLGEDLHKFELQRLIGEEMVRRQFPVNGLIDMLIIRAQNKLRELFGDEATKERSQAVASLFARRV